MSSYSRNLRSVRNGAPAATLSLQKKPTASERGDLPDRTDAKKGRRRSRSRSPSVSTGAMHDEPPTPATSHTSSAGTGAGIGTRGPPPLTVGGTGVAHPNPVDSSGTGMDDEPPAPSTPRASSAGTGAGIGIRGPLPASVSGADVNHPSSIADCGNDMGDTHSTSSIPDASRSSQGGRSVYNSSSADRLHDVPASSSSTVAAPKDPPTKLHMIQSAHGDTLLLEFAEGRVEDGERKFWMIDGGPGNSLRYYQRTHHTPSCS